MRYLKIIGLFISCICMIQTLTYFTISQNSLIKGIGKNYETFVFEYAENIITDVHIISTMNPSKRQIEENFNVFNSYNFEICEQISTCSYDSNSDYFYLYSFYNNTKNPFTINIIREGEMAKEFGAAWESKYVWILFRWILLDKRNTSVS